MRSCAIISEYNPFHNGHAYQICEARKLGYDTVIAIMSGNLMQRGDIAVFDKFTRAKASLYGGADAVVELPSVYAMSHAARFADAGVYLAKELGCDAVIFGSESGNIEKLNEIAQNLSSEELNRQIGVEIKSGISYPAARQKAYEKLFGECPELQNPNDTLGLEYIAAAKKYGSIKCECIKRIGVCHDSEISDGIYSSASHIRELIEKNDFSSAARFMPPQSSLLMAECEKSGHIATKNNLDNSVLAKLRTLSPAELSNLPGVSDGLDFRIYAAIKKATTLDELLGMAKTKRFTMARIKRILLAAYFGINEDEIPATPPYIRILGFNKNGEAFIKAGSFNIPVIFRATELKGNKLFELECRITDIYVLSNKSPLPCGSEMTNGIIKIMK